MDLIKRVTEQTEFSDAIDKAKVETLTDAAAYDDKFVSDFKAELKNAALKAAQLEKEKQELEKKNILLQQQFIKTQDELEAQKQRVNDWNNKRDKRQYAYDGLKDIMLFINVQNPMWQPLMYSLAFLVSPA